MPWAQAGDREAPRDPPSDAHGPVLKGVWELISGCEWSVSSCKGGDWVCANSRRSASPPEQVDRDRDPGGGKFPIGTTSGEGHAADSGEGRGQPIPASNRQLFAKSCTKEGGKADAEEG